MMSRVLVASALNLMFATASDECQDDTSSALQKLAQVANHDSKIKSQLDRVLEAVHNTAANANSICLTVKVGEVAPFAGTFTPRTGKQMAVNAGDVAAAVGEYCVQNSVVALVQRASNFQGSSAIESAVADKDASFTGKSVEATTTTTTAAATTPSTTGGQDGTPSTTGGQDGAEPEPETEPETEPAAEPTEATTWSRRYALGNPGWGQTLTASADYKNYLQGLDVAKLYTTIKQIMTTSQDSWPADGPADNFDASYAGLFGRLAWHCAGSLKVVNGKSTGGCEGGRIRFWPESEWRDNGNLHNARALLAEVKEMPDFQQLSWGDLITFAGTVGIKASGGPAQKFCFGRNDEGDGSASVMLGTEGIEDAPNSDYTSHAPCPETFHWPEQDTADEARCALNQTDGREQASHSVGLMYVFPYGPKLAKDQPDYNAALKHQRSPTLSAKEVRDTFSHRMGWTDQETVALIGGGHTLGRAHGNCASNPNTEEKDNCSGKGKYTKTSGFDGYWTLNPSKWNYDYFDGLFDAEWTPTQSPDGLDQWETATAKFSNTMRLTADLALINDEVYLAQAQKYKDDHAEFDNDFANAWFKLMHRSTAHPHEDDLENDANLCTDFSFVA